MAEIIIKEHVITSSVAKITKINFESGCGHFFSRQDRVYSG